MSSTQLRTLEDVAHEHILRVVEACNGNQTLAAKFLQIDRKTLYRQLKRMTADARSVRQDAAPPRHLDAATHLSRP